jgi:thioredoxin reductase (NADPH)
MAAALMRQLSGDRIAVTSAGTKPGDNLNALSIETLEAVGASVEGEYPKQLTEQMMLDADRGIVLGEEAQLPEVDGAVVERWITDEPSLRGIDGRERMDLVRDDINARVRTLSHALLGEESGTDVRDVIIVGSGPAGYTAAIYTARSLLKPLVIAGSVEAGGELMKTTEVENFPGFPEGIMGPELMGKLQEQAEKFGAEVLYEDATAVELEGEVKKVVLMDGTIHRARTVILATGSAYRELGLDSEARLSGHGVSWCATCDGFFFREQEIAVVGGGDSAMEEALILTKFASKVTVIHRRDSLRASKIMADRALAHPKIEFVWNSEVADVLGEDKVTGVRLRNLNTGEESELAVTGVFVAIGNDPRVALVKDQVQITGAGTIAVDGRSSRTSVDGVFAAGDVLDPTYRQAITAAGSGCVAGQDVWFYLSARTLAESAAVV